MDSRRLGLVLSLALLLLPTLIPAAEPVADLQLIDESGPLHLSGLFGDQTYLLVLHSRGTACSLSTLQGDTWQGLLPRLRSRMNVVLVAPDPPPILRSQARERHWDYRLASDPDGSFGRMLGFATEISGETQLIAGFSLLERDRDGRISRRAREEFRPGSVWCPLWPLLKLLPPEPAQGEPGL